MKILNKTKIWVLADQAVFSGTSFLMTILVARNLSVSDFGEFSAIILVSYLAISAISAWTTQVFQVAANRSKGYISFIFWAQIILLLIFATLLKSIFSLFSFDILNAAVLFGIGFVLYDFSRKILLALDKISATLILDILTSILTLTGFYIFQQQIAKNINDLLPYFSNAYLISVVFTMFIIKPFYFSLITYKVYITSHIKEGKWLFFTALSQWWAGNLFVVASGYYLGTAALGALRLGQSVFGVLNVILQTFENYILPQTALRMQQSQTTGITYLKKMNQKLAYVFIPVLLVVFIFAAPILKFVGGNDYTEYAYILKGLSILYIFIFISQPVRFLIRSLQMNNHFFYAYFLSLVFALLTSGWLISGFGLYGVISGLIGSQLVLMAYLSFILKLKNINLWKSSTSF